MGPIVPAGWREWSCVSFRRYKVRGCGGNLLVGQVRRSPSIFPPTNASTVARSRRFQVAPPILALVSPR